MDFSLNASKYYYDISVTNFNSMCEYKSNSYEKSRIFDLTWIRINFLTFLFVRNVWMKAYPHYNLSNNLLSFIWTDTLIDITILSHFCSIKMDECENTSKALIEWSKSAIIYLKKLCLILPGIKPTIKTRIKSIMLNAYQNASYLSCKMFCNQ